MWAPIVDKILGPCIRRIPPTPGEAPRLYLTFDDGPDENATPTILEVLARHGARATFFVIADRVRTARPILRETLASGHAFGNHSLDHRFANFFRSDPKLAAWLKRAETELMEMAGQRPLAFRSPAGVRTPPLRRALRQLNWPLVHWNVRFYDTRYPWTEARAQAAWPRTPAGSIVLLHDRQRPEVLPQFLKTLDAYLREGRERGFEFHALDKYALTRAMLPSGR